MPQSIQFATGILVALLLLGCMSVWSYFARRLATGNSPVEYEPRLPVPWSGVDLAVLLGSYLFVELLTVGWLVSQSPPPTPVGPVAVVSEQSETLSPGESADDEPAARDQSPADSTDDGQQRDDPSSEAAEESGDEPAAADESQTHLSIESVAVMGLLDLVWLAFAVLYLIRVSGALLGDLGIRSSRIPADVRSGVLLFLAAIAPVYGLQLLLIGLWQEQGWEVEHPVVKLVHEQPDILALVLASFATVVVAPLVEEFIFRVLLQGWLEKKEHEQRRTLGLEASPPSFWPVVFSAIAFALPHYGQGPAPAALFILALFLGYAYRQTHRIYASLVIHILVNSMAMAGLWVSVLTGE